MGGIEREFGRRQPRDPAAIRGHIVVPQRKLPARVLVFFGSKPGDLTLLAGDPIPRETPFDQVHAEMLKIARPKVDVVSAWHGAVPTSHQGPSNPLLKTDKGVDGAISDIKETKVPLKRVIVYGYSLGGTDALSLSRRLIGIGAKIDLMITVDAAVPLSSGEVDRRVGDSVAKNINFFQTHPHGLTGSRGGRNEGRRSVVNDDRTAVYEKRADAAHLLIHGDTVQEAIAAIRNEFFSL